MINPNTYNSLYGLSMQQSWEDLALWEWFLNRVIVKSIIELGSGSGAFSCYLLTQCISRGITFVTIDHRPPEMLDGVFYRRVGLDKTFTEIDILSLEGSNKVKKIIKQVPKPLLLYCDNGDKPQEVALFSPELKQGDYLGVHDFGIEFHEYNLQPVVDRIVEIGKPEETRVARTRWFKVIR